MRRFLSLALIAAVLVVIPAGSASAVPDDSQRLRGMAGRSFAVTVENLDGIPGLPAVFPNCYTFNAQGEWVDAGWPNPGTWEQDSVGAQTSYEASATESREQLGLPEELGPGTGRLDQEGHVTPARGKGVLQLEAHNVLSFTPDGGAPIIFGRLRSTGYEVEVPNCGL